MTIADIIYMLSAVKNTPRIQALEQKINRLKTQLGTLGPLRPGSLSRQYHVCCKPGCRCQDPRKPQRHGPYYHLDYMVVREQNGDSLHKFSFHWGLCGRPR